VSLAEFDYCLPEARIAQHPVEPRDAARLLVDNGPDQPPDDRVIRDLTTLLRSGDLVVVNDTRVIPARLHLRRASGAAIEVLLVERLGSQQWEALVRGSRKVHVGERLSAGDLTVEVGAASPERGTRTVQVLAEDPMAALAEHGIMPLPPYITESLGDPERYQTVYSRRPGAAAAPTAGLHFTTELLADVAACTRGVERVELVVGLDTFRPMSVEHIADHRMHSESFTVADDVLERCRQVRSDGGRVVAVGTTTVRALESAAAGHRHRTDLFVRSPFSWQVVDVLLTNFHLPRSSLLVMIDAFVGPRWRALYDHALANNYRFLSFGDAMLVERTAP
jgi:S-adenosylmethionine:tRNA ribosyltransferase-isomerase